MAFDKFINKAKNLANDPKIREKLNSEKVEKFSDQVLDKAAGAADSLTKGKYTDKIQGARDAADRVVGTDSPQGGAAQDRPTKDRPAQDRQSPAAETDPTREAGPDSPATGGSQPGRP